MLVSRNFVDLIAFSRATAGWRYNAAGLLVQEANGVARFDYDPVTQQPLGLLIEEARTNVLLRSNALTTSPWSSAGTGFIGALAASTDIPAPDGSSGVFKVTAVNSQALALRQTGLSLSAGAAAASIWVYVPSGQSGVSDFQLNVDWNDVDSGSFMASTVFNKWVRLSSVATLTATRTQLDYNIRTAAGNFPAGTVFYLQFAQAEAAAAVSSYVATAAASASRSADTALITDLTKIGFNPQAGTIYAEFIAPNMAAAANQSIFALSDGTTANRIQPFINAGVLTTRVTTGGAAADFSGAISGASQVHKLAIGCAAGSAALSVDGGAAAQSSPTAFPAVTKLCLGSGADGISAFLNGYLRALRYYPRKLSNAELQALTA